MCARTFASHLAYDGVVVCGGAHVLREGPLHGGVCLARADVGDKHTPQPSATDVLRDPDESVGE